jgi:hypothetical protein
MGEIQIFKVQRIPSSIGYPSGVLSSRCAAGSDLIRTGEAIENPGYISS